MIDVPTKTNVYVNEDGDLWVPVEGHSYRDARAMAPTFAREQWSQRVVYHGKVTIPLTEHEYGCSCEPSCYVERLAYHFEGIE